MAGSRPRYAAIVTQSFSVSFPRACRRAHPGMRAAVERFLWRQNQMPGILPGKRDSRGTRGPNHDLN